MESEPEIGLVQAQPSTPLTILVQVPAEVVMYNVTEQELESLASGGSSVHVAFFGSALGAFIVFLVTILTVHLADRLLAIFVSLTVVSGTFTLYFAIRSYMALKENKGRLEVIRARRRR